MQWEKVALIGVGLLGGSLGLALKRRGLARRVHGFVRRESAIAECVGTGAVDAATREMAEAVRDAELIVLCTPLGRMKPLTEAMLPSVRSGAIITDVGSVKASVVDELEPLAKRAGAQFIGSHPMAGSELVGVRHAREDLFDGAVCVLTPTATGEESAVVKLKQLWSGVGGKPYVMSAALHDELVGRTSHLPHIVAAELARYVLDPSWPAQQLELCATGFRDATRIASGSPEMWCDISLANRVNLIQELKGLTERLHRFQFALEKCDEEAIQYFFEEARRRREAWCDQNASPSREL
jgi:prephenate dehydrogenase